MIFQHSFGINYFYTFFVHVEILQLEIFYLKDFTLSLLLDLFFSYLAIIKQLKLLLIKFLVQVRVLHCIHWNCFRLINIGNNLVGNCTHRNLFLTK